jgi:hypothetical protein
LSGRGTNLSLPRPQRRRGRRWHGATAEIGSGEAAEHELEDFALKRENFEWALSSRAPRRRIRRPRHRGESEPEVLDVVFDVLELLSEVLDVVFEARVVRRISIRVAGAPCRLKTTV